ncbi:MAG TPA: DinB family protein [Longimicrobiales bacterium]|nr:DinB family protein [Longimicrobiales bacterium]
MEEPWLRGAVPGVVAELQPMVHELLFAKEELERIFESLSDDDMWGAQSGIAAIGYHVRHCSGSTLRMLTYARGESLSDDQFIQLQAEKTPDQSLDKAALWQIATNAIDEAIAFAKSTHTNDLDQPRLVGRKKLQSNVRGLLYEIAIHTARHVGQIATTAKLLQAK